MKRMLFIAFSTSSSLSSLMPPSPSDRDSIAFCCRDSTRGILLTVWNAMVRAVSPFIRPMSLDDMTEAASSAAASVFSTKAWILLTSSGAIISLRMYLNLCLDLYLNLNVHTMAPRELRSPASSSSSFSRATFSAPSSSFATKVSTIISSFPPIFCPTLSRSVLSIFCAFALFAAASSSVGSTFSFSFFFFVGSKLSFHSSKVLKVFTSSVLSVLDPFLTTCDNQRFRTGGGGGGGTKPLASPTFDGTTMQQPILKSSRVCARGPSPKTMPFALLSVKISYLFLWPRADPPADPFPLSSRRI